MSSRAGIQPLSIHAPGFTSPATMKTLSYECNFSSYALIVHHFYFQEIQISYLIALYLIASLLHRQGFG